MKLPQLDPNFVLWCTLIADVVTTVASSVAVITILRRLTSAVTTDLKKRL